MLRLRPSGFTLTEVLIALGIVAFGLLSLLTLLPVGLRSTGLAGDLTTAAFLAEQELGRIRANAAVRDFIDSNLDNTLDDTDFNGVQDAGEPYESGWLLSEFADIAVVAAGTAVATGMAFPPEYVPLNLGTGAFDEQVAAAYTVTAATAQEERFTFRCIDATTAGLEVFSVVGSVSGRQPDATTGVAYATTGAELTGVVIPAGFTTQDGTNGVDWAVGDEFSIRTCSECRDGDGLGYFDLPPSLKKGRLINVRAFGVDDLTPPAAQTWTITCNAVGVPATFAVVGSSSGAQGTATVGTPFTATSGEVTFQITDNDSHIYEGENAYNAGWQVGDRFLLHVAVVENAWYAYFAQRADVGEDRLFPNVDLAADGFDNDADGTTDEVGEAELDGVLTSLADPSVTPADPRDDFRPEDTGLDLVPSFIDEDRDGVADAAEPAGEVGFNRVTNPDPHGDEGVTENNRRTIAPFTVDHLPEHEVQRVFVTVTWREGGRAREERFGTVVANPYPWP